MEKVDKRNRFDEEVFSYRATKDGKVFLYWYKKQVKILKGPAAQEFLEDIADVDQREAQLKLLLIFLSQIDIRYVQMYKSFLRAHFGS